MGLHSQAHQEAKQDRPFDLELGKQKHLCTVNSWRFNKERTKGMKPTISIFEDEIVITTDSFDLILKTGAERKSVEIESEPLTEEEKNWKFKPSFDDMEKSIEEFTERYPEDVVLNKELKKVPEHIDNFLKGKTKHTRNLPAKPCKICGNDFKPTWNTQHYCPACKPKYYGQKRKPLAEQTAEELEKTLQEIENRRKKPYEFK